MGATGHIYMDIPDYEYIVVFINHLITVYILPRQVYQCIFTLALDFTYSIKYIVYIRFTQGTFLTNIKSNWND